MNILHDVSEDGKCAFVNLRNYLCPGETYNYNDLPDHLESLLDKYPMVMLMSCSQSAMVIGYHNCDGLKYWSKAWNLGDQQTEIQFTSAREALK